MKPIYIPCFIAVALIGGACSNIASSELRETKAQDLRLTATVSETNGEPRAEARSILRTIPDDIGVQFNQGETLTVTAQAPDDSFLPNISMAYDSNFLNLGEQYVASVQKPAVGKKYSITYQDADGERTTAEFSSDGVPELSVPANGQEAELGGQLTLSWNPQNLGAMWVSVEYRTVGGGWAYASRTMSDTGSYALDLAADAFDDAAAGEAEVRLNHATEYSSMPGFGDADIRVVSASLRTVEFRRTGNAPAALVAGSNYSSLSEGEVADLCRTECGPGETKRVNYGQGWVDCCEGEGHERD